MKDNSEKKFNLLLDKTNQLLQLDLSKKDAEKAAKLIGDLAGKIEKNLDLATRKNKKAA